MSKAAALETANPSWYQGRCQSKEQKSVQVNKPRHPGQTLEARLIPAVHQFHCRNRQQCMPTSINCASRLQSQFEDAIESYLCTNHVYKNMKVCIWPVITTMPEDDHTMKSPGTLCSQSNRSVLCILGYRWRSHLGQIAVAFLDIQQGALISRGASACFSVNSIA